MLVWLDNHTALDFVFRNLRALIEAGVYERVLVETFIGCQHNWSQWPIHILHMMFNAGDKGKVLSYAQPAPGGFPLTVYRGVAGIGKQRRIRGLSWTTDLDMARWFAERSSQAYGLKSPAAYEAQVEQDQFYGYYPDNRGEHEVICIMPSDHPVKVAWKE